MLRLNMARTRQIYDLIAWPVFVEIMFRTLHVTLKGWADAQLKTEWSGRYDI